MVIKPFGFLLPLVHHLIWLNLKYKISNDKLFIDADGISYRVYPDYENICIIAVNKKTGEFDGLNCHDEEKVRRLNEVIDNYEVIEAYSDSTADIPILKLANKSFYVKGNKIIPTDF